MSRMLRLLIGAAAVPLLALAGTPAPAAGAAARLPDRVIVTFASTRAAAGAADLVGAARLIGPRVLAVAGAAAATVARQPGVLRVEPDVPYRLMATPNDPCASGAGCGTAGVQAHLAKIGAYQAWDFSHGNGVTVAILDSGIQTDHPDLAAKLVGPEVNVTGSAAGTTSHGTAIAGLVAAATDNGTGVAGVGWESRLLSIKIVNAPDPGTASSVIAGINEAVNRGAKVINMSAGSEENSQAVADAVANAASHGVIMVAAGGNLDGGSATTPIYPAALPGVIAVAGSTASDTLASFSRSGSWIDLAAPGVDLLTTTDGSAYTKVSGTSAASPIVAGAAALLVAQGIDTNPAAVEAHLVQTAAPMSSTSIKRLDAGTALTSIGPYGAFAGGANVARGDLDPAGGTEIVTGAGPGGGPHVRLFSATGGAIGGGFFAYSPAFGGGVDVAVGDVDPLPGSEIITGAGAGGGPHVKVFTATGIEIRGFFAYDPGFHGGVRVATADVDGDGTDEIITGPGAGGGPHVRVFRGDGSAMGGGFFAYDPAFTGGVDVGGGNLDGSGGDEIVAGAGPGGGPHVAVFRGDGSALAGFFPYPPGFTGGVEVSVGNIDGGAEEIVTGPGPGGGPHARLIRLAAGETPGFFAFDPAVTSGLDVSLASDGYAVVTRAGVTVLRVFPPSAQ